MPEFSNLTDILVKQKHQHGKGVTFIEGSKQEVFLSYKALFDAASNALAYLQERKMKAGDELVFQTDDNQVFIVVFWACILGGIIPVPVSTGKNEEHKTKFFNIWKVLNNPRLIASAGQFEVLEQFAGGANLAAECSAIRQTLLYANDLMSYTGFPKIQQSKRNDIAFVQFSSGSTGSPKGVILTHGNLLANLEAIGAGAGYSEHDSTISWMPLTHDMGLIGFHLNPLFYGMNQYIIPTPVFIRRPAIWLDKTSEHKTTILCSPNFGYKYVMERCDFSEQKEWDLSGVRIVYNGAEPISLQLCQGFNSRMGMFGLKANAMCPVYGLAEASLAVSMSEITEEVKWKKINRLSAGYLSPVKEAEGEDEGIHFVNVGQPVKYCSVQIGGTQNEPLPDGVVGQIMIKGINVTSGYYNNITATNDLLTDSGWLKTGDLGFFLDKHLYITGRSKDILFINGQNYYPYDVERVAEEAEGITLNKIAVAGHTHSATGKEEMIAFVYHRGILQDFLPVIRSLKKVVGAKMGIEIDKVIPVKDIPKTTSGKLQRFRLLERYLAGDFQKTEEELNQLLFPGNGNIDTDMVQPENSIEAGILSVWKKVLKTGKIGVTHHFFEAGGNSLKIAEMSMLVQKEFGVAIPDVLLYEKLTVRELAKQLPGFKKYEHAAIPRAEKQAYYPLSAAQRGIYYNWEIDKTSTAYNMPVAFRIKGKLDAGKWERCIATLLAQYDVFRTRFRMADEPVMETGAPVSFSLVTEKCNSSELNNLLKAQVQPFDLHRGPLFRTVLFQTEKHDHILFIDIHHIISDGLSVYDFLYKLQLLYEGTDIIFPQTSYADYACWQRELIASDQLKTQEQFWLRQFDRVLPLLEMPADFSRPLVFNPKGSKMRFQLDASTTMRLNAFARMHNISLHVLLFTVYNLLLSKYSRQTEIITGIPVAGRTHPDVQDVQGMFVNNLAIATRMEGTDTFLNLVESVKNSIAGALKHQDYPFELLAAHVSGSRDISRNPVFDTMFIYQNMGIPNAENCSIQLEEYFFDPGFAKFDISMEVFESAPEICYHIEYATALFKESTIIRLAGHFNNLVNQVLDNPSSRLCDIIMISKAEHDFYTYTFNATQSPFPQTTIHELFEQQVQRFPGAVALVYENTTVTFKELNDKADRLAAVLMHNGICPDSVTGILLERSPGLIISILAVLKAGGAYLSIDDGLPEERMMWLLSDSAARVLITDSNHRHLIENAPAANGENVFSIIDIDACENAELTDAPVTSSAAPGNLAYVIYTSGTTGKPKGVMIEHRSLVNYITWAAARYLPEGRSTFAFYSSVSFDLTITSIFTPLITGNTMVIYKDDVTEMLIEKVIADNRADVIKLTPAHLRVLQNNNVSPLANNRLKVLIVGGEQLETGLARNVYDQFGGRVRIYNEYGPTEATVGCMIHQFQPGTDSLNVPVGVPAVNTSVYLLDSYLRPVPEGVPGDMYIAGEGVARGYLFQPEATREKFIPNPFDAGGKMYKTGDTAKRLHDGTIEYIGRTDLQVKLNGHRIEPAEIAGLLMEFPGAGNVLVTIKKNKTGNRVLCAYYTGKAEEAELRNFLARKLPYYMAPAYYISIPGIPLTANGKTNYHALPEIVSETKQYEGVISNTESILLKVWGEVLQAEELSVTDNFFELGGDSIKAVQITARLFKEGILLKARDILRYHTIAQVSLHAEAADSGKTYQQGILAGRKIMSPVESWFFSQNFHNPNYFTQSVCLSLNRAVNIPLLEKAFKLLITHHDGLRLNYHAAEKYLYINNSHLEAPFTIEQPEQFFHEKQKDQFCSSIKASFDISKSLLIKAAWLRSGAEDIFGSLFITAHHLVMDGVSWRILLTSLVYCYNTLEQDGKIEMPLKTASLPDYAVAEKKYAEENISAAEREYWQNISQINFTLPAEKECHSWQIKYQKKVSGVLGSEDTGFLLHGAHHAYKTDVPVLLNVALAATLREWTGSIHFVIEQEHQGRVLEDVDTSSTVGWFTTMYPAEISMPVSGMGECIKAVKEQLRNVPLKGVGFGMIRYTHGVTMQSPVYRAPETQFRFNYLGQFDNELNNDLFSYHHSSAGSESDPENHITAVVELNMMIVNGQCRFDILYNSLAHIETTMEWFAGRFHAHILEVLEHVRSEHEIHFTPSDFDTANLDSEDLDVLFSS